MVKVLYIAHEIGGDVDGNVQRVLDICRRVHTREVIPFAPYLMALQYLDDEDPEDRVLGVEANNEFLRRRVPDTIGVFGTGVSRGIFGELELGLKYGIPVEVHDERAAVEVGYALKGLNIGVRIARNLVGQRELPGGNVILISKDYLDRDLTIVESEKVTDPETGLDVTRFTPKFTSTYDEALYGWKLIRIRMRTMSKEERRKFLEASFDAIACNYGSGRLLNDFEKIIP